jgi:hypothetical protein
MKERGELLKDGRLESRLLKVASNVEMLLKVVLGRGT